MTHCSQLILRKNICATRCQTLRLRCTTLDFHWGSAPNPLGKLTALHQTTVAVFKGPTSKGGEGKGEAGMGGKGEGKGREREGNRRGREGRVRDGRGGARPRTPLKWRRRRSNEVDNIRDRLRSAVAKIFLTPQLNTEFEMKISSYCTAWNKSKKTNKPLCQN